MTLKEIQLKLYTSLEGTGWDDKLKLFLLSADFTNILKVLLSESQSKKHFTPVIKDMFRAFQECPYPDVKVVMLNATGYSKINFDDGIAFSLKDQDVPVGTLKYIFEDLQRTGLIDTINQTTDLKRWSNQGVLLLNTALTSTLSKPDSHQELWQPFMEALFDSLATHTSGVIFVFFGKKTKIWHKHVKPNNFKFFIPHPITGVYNNSKLWNSGNLFKNINEILNKQNSKLIKW